MICKVEPEEIQAIQKSNIVQQTAFWARVKNKQGVIPYAFKYKTSINLLFPSQNSNKIIQNDLLILVRNIDRNHCIAYVPYGPKNEPDSENHGKFLEELSEVIKSYLPKNCIVIRYDLPWENQWSKEEDYYDSKGNWIGPPTNRNQEFRVNYNTNKWNLIKCQTNILPSNTIFLNLKDKEEKIMNKMKPKTRYNIRLSKRKGINVQSYGMEKLDDWYLLYQETAIRNGISLHDKEYFHSVLTTHTDDLQSPVDVRLLMADYKGEFLAAMFLILSKNRGTYLYGASSNNNRNFMATYALQWEAILKAKQADCEEYDMFGTSPSADPAHPLFGLYRFKSGFGGKLFHRMGCWDYPIDHKNYEMFRAQEVNSPKYHTN